VHRVTREFFALPDDDRMAIANVNSPQFRGYTPVGHEYTQGRPDRRDELDVGHELPEPRLGPDDPPWLRLRGPNQWPAMQPPISWRRRPTTRRARSYLTFGFDEVASGLSASMGARVAFVNRATAQYTLKVRISSVA